MTLKDSGSLAVAAGLRLSSSARAACGHFQKEAQAAARRLFGGIGGAGWAAADQCVVSAANFLTILLFARYLETATFGAFMLVYTGLLLLTNMQNALVTQPHNVLAAGLEAVEYRRFTGALVILQLLYCLAVCFALAVAGSLIAAGASAVAGETLIALGATAVPWMGKEFVRRALYTRGQARAATINDSISYGLQLFGALVLVQAAAAWATPSSALLVLGISSAVGVLTGVWQLRGHVRFGPRGRGDYLRTWSQVWHFGRWLTAQNALAWFGAQGHSWMVAILLGVEQVGIYRAVSHLVNLMNPLMQACFSYLPSKGSLAYLAGGGSGLAHWVKRTQWVLVLAMVPFLAVLTGFPGAVLELAYGEKYAGGGLALILALATVAQCIGFSKYPFDLGLLALRATRAIFFVYLIPVILLLTAGALLIHFLGILGVPLSAIAINSALLVATWLAYTRRLQREPGQPGSSSAST